MPLLMESQQHTLTDIHGMLVELRRLVSAHGEYLATFGQQTQSEENPDSLDERSPPQRWSPPLSVTQEPMGFKSYSMPRLEPPRFDGENALDWIGKIQRYYNHHYTPLDDRLYLTKYLFDHPASDWMAYWTDKYSDKGWEDFLVAVYHNFTPPLNVHFASDLIEEDVSIVENHVHHSETVVNGFLEINREDAYQAGDTTPAVIEIELSTGACSMGVDAEFLNCEVRNDQSQVEVQHILEFSRDVTRVLDRYGAGRTDGFPDNGVPSDFVVYNDVEVPNETHKTIHLDSSVLEVATDSCIDEDVLFDANLETYNTNVDTISTEPVIGDIDADWSCPLLQLGDGNGVHIFDPGAFEQDDGSVGETSSRLQHGNSMHSSCEDADRSKEPSKARKITTVTAFEYKQPPIDLVMGVDGEFQLLNCTVKWGTDEQQSCDVCGTCRPFGDCDIGASTICGRVFELVDKGEADSGNTLQYATGGTQGEEVISLLLSLKVLDFASQLASRWVDECRGRFLGNYSCIAYVNADYNKNHFMFHNIGVHKRWFSGVGANIHICLSSSNCDIKERYAMISVVVDSVRISVMICIAWPWMVMEQRDNPEWSRVFKAEQIFSVNSAEMVLTQMHPLSLFRFESAANAIYQFLDNNFLGKEIVMKRLSVACGQRIQKYTNYEQHLVISILRTIISIKLKGDCMEKEGKMLIYEYMPTKAWIFVFVITLHHRRIGRRIFISWKAMTWTIAILILMAHLEGKVVFNSGRVDRVLDLADLAQDHLQ